MYLDSCQYLQMNYLSLGAVVGAGSGEPPHISLHSRQALGVEKQGFSAVLKQKPSLAPVNPKGALYLTRQKDAPPGLQL